MLVVGAGLGLNMQTIVLAMQNAVAAADIGVATVVGHVLPPDRRHARRRGRSCRSCYSTVQDKIRAAYAAAANNPAFQEAAKAHPDQTRGCAASGTSSLNDTSFLAHDNPVLAHPFKVGLHRLDHHRLPHRARSC